MFLKLSSTDNLRSRPSVPIPLKTDPFALLHMIGPLLFDPLLYLAPLFPKAQHATVVPGILDQLV